MSQSNWKHFNTDKLKDMHTEKQQSTTVLFQTKEIIMGFIFPLLVWFLFNQVY